MTDYEIFGACFPEIKLTSEQFTRLAEGGSSQRTAYDGGFALTEDDRVTLLAVHPDHRGRGVGTRLLADCEQSIARRGFGSAVLGGDLLCGAGDACRGFFEKRGYILGEEYSEMYADLSEYCDPLPENEARYGFYGGDIGALRDAVAAVEPEWVGYFDGNGDYFCGFLDGRIVSFCIFEDDVLSVVSDGSRCGSVGCVGTIPKARRRGIGLKTVSLALCELKARGCGRCYIHMTALDGWYGKLGAKVLLKYRQGEKQL